MDLLRVAGRSRLAQVLRIRGVRRLLGFALIAELPAGMTALAIVLRITQAGGSYARAGLVGAVGAVGVGVCAPVWSRLVDRRGQTVVLIPTAVAVAERWASFWPSCRRAALSRPSSSRRALMGLFQPPALNCARTLWPSVVTDPTLLETTYSLDSSLTELVFIVGPLLTVAINAALGSAAAVAASGLLAGLGALGLASTKASRQARGAPKTREGTRGAALGRRPVPRAERLRDGHRVRGHRRVDDRDRPPDSGQRRGRRPDRGLGHRQPAGRHGVRHREPGQAGCPPASCSSSR